MFWHYRLRLVEFGRYRPRQVVVTRFGHKPKEAHLRGLPYDYNITGNGWQGAMN
jgi:hypothetical protein